MKRTRESIELGILVKSRNKKCSEFCNFGDSLGMEYHHAFSGII